VRGGRSIKRAVDWGTLRARTKKNTVLKQDRRNLFLAKGGGGLYDGGAGQNIGETRMSSMARRKSDSHLERIDSACGGFLDAHHKNKRDSRPQGGR